MATGIVGTAFATIGHPSVAVAALTIAAVGSVVLILALVARAVLAPDALLWIALVHAMLPWVFTRSDVRPLLSTVDGGWSLLVVSTQSLSVLASAAAAAPALPGDGNAVMLIAMALWSFGTVLIPFFIGLGPRPAPAPGGPPLHVRLVEHRVPHRHVRDRDPEVRRGHRCGGVRPPLGTAAVWCDGAAWLRVAAGGIARIRLSPNRGSAPTRGSASTRAASGGTSA